MNVTWGRLGDGNLDRLEGLEEFIKLRQIHPYKTCGSEDAEKPKCDSIDEFPRDSFPHEY